MKDVIDGPGYRELELISNRRHLFDDNEGAMTFGCKFWRLIREFQVFHFEPYLITRCELVKGRSLGALGQSGPGLFPSSRHLFCSFFHSLMG